MISGVPRLAQRSPLKVGWLIAALVLLSPACGQPEPQPTPPLLVTEPEAVPPPTTPVETPTLQPPTQPAAGATPIRESPTGRPGATAAASPEAQTPRPADTATVVAPLPPPSPTSVAVASPTATAATPSPPAVTIAVTEHPRVGPILTDDAGRTLYLFTGDRRNISNCTDECAVTWPPLLTSADPTAVAPADEIRLGMISRQDGSLQVTYNGWPLYHFSGDVGARRCPRSEF